MEVKQISIVEKETNSGFGEICFRTYPIVEERDGEVKVRLEWPDTEDVWHSSDYWHSVSEFVERFPEFPEFNEETAPGASWVERGTRCGYGHGYMVETAPTWVPKNWDPQSILVAGVSRWCLGRKWYLLEPRALVATECQDSCLEYWRKRYEWSSRDSIYSPKEPPMT